MERQRPAVEKLLKTVSLGQGQPVTEKRLADSSGRPTSAQLQKRQGVLNQQRRVSAKPRG